MTADQFAQLYDLVVMVGKVLVFGVGAVLGAVLTATW